MLALEVIVLGEIHPKKSFVNSMRFHEPGKGRESPGDGHKVRGDVSRGKGEIGQEETTSLGEPHLGPSPHTL